MSTTKRVLHIINGEFYAGAERVQDLLALRLPEQGYEVGFTCLKEGLFAEKRKAKDVPLYSFPMRSKLDVGLAFRLSRLAKREGYSLIHTHSPRAALVGLLAAQMSGLPMVHHLHSPTNADTDEGGRNRRNSIVEKLSLLRVKKLIPVSRSLENYLLERGYRQDRITVVCNGVPMHEKARRSYTQGEQMVIGTVALFRPRKGLEILLHALAQLKQNGQNVKLHAVGTFETNEYHKLVENLVNKLGLANDIHWTGFTGDVAAEFQNMHVFVLPSLFGEGMPMVVLEAMSAGLPVVSTRVEGIPEVIREGQDGLLVESGSIEELVETFQNLITKKVDGDALGDSGWLHQRQSFSDIAMAKGVAAVYNEVIEE